MYKNHEHEIQLKIDGENKEYKHRSGSNRLAATLLNSKCHHESKRRKQDGTIYGLIQGN